jgi:hypothetical protein
VGLGGGAGTITHERRTRLASPSHEAERRRRDVSPVLSSLFSMGRMCSTAEIRELWI